jgi:hypothetical protein
MTAQLKACPQIDNHLSKLQALNREFLAPKQIADFDEQLPPIIR